VTLLTGVPVPQPDLSRPHFVGIGGMSMSGLALICAARGARVTGSDADPVRLAELAAAGIPVQAGHDVPPPGDASCVVWSTAIADDNPELVAARAAGIPVVHRAQALQALANDRTFLAVSGTHGKSSTTGMLATILTGLGGDPSYAIGAVLAGAGISARQGGGLVFAAEADESDRSFHWLKPDVAVVINVTDDHPENYSGLADHVSAYVRFAGGITSGGTLVINVDDPGAAEVAARLRGSRADLRVVTVGTAPGADWRIAAIGAAGMSSATTVSTPDGQQVTITLPVPGRHMALNAVTALAAAVEAGAPVAGAVQALGGYQGVRGRLTLRADQAGVKVLDSFAHHPVEIAADIEAARLIAGDVGKVLAVYQPRGYTRTLAYAAPMAAELAAADLLVLLDIHAPTWEPNPGASSSLITDAGNGQLASPPAAVSLVTEAARPGDVVLVMGSGALAEQVCATLGGVLQAPPSRREHPGEPGPHPAGRAPACLPSGRRPARRGQGDR
jgi:UDP-N-acetylmuramate--alanine ligase